MIPLLILIGALWYFSRQHTPGSETAPKVPTAWPPRTTPELSLSGDEVARLPDGTTQPLSQAPVEGQPAPFPPGTVVDIPSMEPLYAGYCVAPDGTWQRNMRPMYWDQEPPTIAVPPDSGLTVMHTGGGFITLPDGRVVPL